MPTPHRINHQPIFLLTSKPWRENSLWVEAFSRDYGRVALLARSARTRGSELRGVLIPFVPISASWFGKEELKTLHRAEWLGGWAQPSGRALFSAMYVNELVLKLTMRDDPHADVYDALHDVMRAIGTQADYVGALRQFEWRLLNALGIAPDFMRDGDGADVVDENWYWVRPDEVVKRVDEHEILTTGERVQGRVLRQICAGVLSDDALSDGARVMRSLIDFRVPELKTRQVLQQLNGLKRKL